MLIFVESPASALHVGGLIRVPIAVDVILLKERPKFINAMVCVGSNSKRSCDLDLFEYFGI